tara:strand:+ start:967 stop:1881 length:915 start_codon:yes stop_codon:yes gene_type:complete
MKIMFNRKIIDGPWGGGNLFVNEMTNYLRQREHEVCFDFEDDIDIIFMVDPRPVDHSEGYSVDDIIDYGRKYPDTEIIHRINECDQRKGTDFMDSLLLRSNVIADHTIFISEWLANYFIDLGFDREYDVVYNGCNTNHFYPLENKLKPSNPIKLVTHHWSDNWLKGFDLYNELDKQNRNDIEFTYIGRYNNQYRPKNTRIVSPLHGEELGNELRKHDVYITASRFEPCGMHHIEGSASGLPVLYHRDGGGINELCKTHGIGFDDIPSFFQSLQDILNNYDNFVSKINYSYLSSERMCAEYYKNV